MRLAFRLSRGGVGCQLDELYDRAAAFIEVGGMTWTEYWATPVVELNRYAAALHRRAEAQKG